MKVSEVYGGGNYLNAQICEREHIWNRELVITNVTKEDLRGNTKLVLSFADLGYRLPLNKTNANVIAERYGDDTQGWISKPIRLVKTKQNFQGRLVDAIMVVV